MSQPGPVVRPLSQTVRLGHSSYWPAREGRDTQSGGSPPPPHSSMVSFERKMAESTFTRTRMGGSKGLDQGRPKVHGERQWRRLAWASGALAPNVFFCSPGQFSLNNIIH